MNLNMLNVESVSKIFIDGKNKVDVLRGVSFSANKGEFISILGPSGCGKTTLLRIIAGLLQPTKGAVYANGKKITSPSIDRGMVFQSYTSFDWLTVEKNIEFGLELNKIPVTKRRNIVDYYLKAVGLEGFRRQFPRNLSGGMKQRLALARTLANKPKILLMDEPFGALDFDTRWEMRKLLLDVWGNENCTVIFVTHDVEEALYLSERILLISFKPATIFKNIKVSFARPRDMQLKFSSTFIKIEEEILNILVKMKNK